MYDILICDDEAMHIEALRDGLMQIDKENEFRLHLFNHPEDLKKYMEKNAIEEGILFIDIELGQENGIHTVKELQETFANLVIVYVTGHSQYCMDVYETEHCYFLLKPYDQAHLEAAVKKASGKLSEERGRKVERIEVKKGSETIFLRCDEICCVESQGRKVYITMREQRRENINASEEKNTWSYETYDSLKRFEKELGKNFVRCHQSFIVNLAEIEKISKKEIKLKNMSDPIPISRSHVEEVKQAQLRYLGGTL